MFCARLWPEMLILFIFFNDLSCVLFYGYDFIYVVFYDLIYVFISDYDFTYVFFMIGFMLFLYIFV